MAERETLLREVIEEIGRILPAVLARRFPSLTPAEKDDLEQEVRLKLWRSLRDGKKIRNFRSYVWRVIFTTALDLVEARGRWSSLDDIRDRAGREPAEDPGPSPEAAWEDRALRERLLRAVDDLPPRRRLVLRHYLEGRGLEETARAEGLTVHQVRHLLYRGIGTLRKGFGRRVAAEGLARSERRDA